MVEPKVMFCESRDSRKAEKKLFIVLPVGGGGGPLQDNSLS